MSEFVYPVRALSMSRDLHFKEFTHLHYKTFNKTLGNLDKDIFEIYVNKLLSDLCTTDVDIDTLTVLDKFYILLNIRAYCVSPTITFQTLTIGEKPEKLNIEINLNDMLDTLYDVKLEYGFSIGDDHLTIKGNFPKQFHFDDVYDIAIDSITDVIFGTKTVPFNNLDKDEKKEVFGKLPSFAITRIIEHLQKQDGILRHKPIVDIKTKHDIEMRKQIYPSILDGSLPEIIKVMFKSPLKEFYVNEYQLIRRFKFSMDAINKCTPAELGLYFNIISQDLEREKKEQERAQGHNNMGAGGAPVGGMPEGGMPQQGF